MPGQSIGQQLDEAGWDQGVLLPPLCWSVVYHPETPLTAIAKKAVRQPGIHVSVGSHSIPPHQVATGITRQEDYLVVASQACDIVKSPDYESTVIAIRAFTTNNQKILDSAGANSARHFLLDPKRSLVADATVVVNIEKPVLLTLTPLPGVPDEQTRQRFARWLARRYNRPPLDDSVVWAVQKPILDNLRTMQESNDPALRALDDVEEVRIAHVQGPLPYSVRLLFVVQKAGLDDDRRTLTHLAGTMRGWFDPQLARLEAWDALDLYQISVGDYLETDQLPLDHYTYQGQTIPGPRAAIHDLSH